MKTSRIIWLAIAVYMAALLIYAPAQLISNLVSHYSDNKVFFAATEGTVWKGSAHLILNGNENTLPIDIGKLSWDVKTPELLMGKLSTAITWNDTPPFWLSIDTTRIHIEHAAFSLPGTAVAYLVPVLAAAELGGQITMRCENLSITSDAILGQIDIDWAQVSSPLSTVNPLGNFHANLVGAGSSFNISLQTTGNGPLVLQGNGSVGIRSPLHFEATANSNQENKQQLQQLLQVIGNESPQGSGIYKVNI